MPGLWKNEPEIEGGKYLVLRRDGSQPEWPYFVLGARDPAAALALKAYAKEARRRGMSEKYCADVENLSEDFITFRFKHGPGDPDAPRHREDDPEIVARMGQGIPS